MARRQLVTRPDSLSILRLSRFSQGTEDWSSCSIVGSLHRVTVSLFHGGAPGGCSAIGVAKKVTVTDRAPVTDRDAESLPKAS